MPSDIRSFFGGKASAGEEHAADGKPNSSKKGRNARRVVDDSDDDEVIMKSATSQKVQSQKRERTPEGEATTTAAYFGKSKPKKSEPVKTSAASKKNAVETPKPSPAKAKETPKSTRSQTSSKATPMGRSSARKKTRVNYNEDADLNGVNLLEDEKENEDDVFAADFKETRKNGGDDYEESEDGFSDADLKPTRQTSAKSRQSRSKKESKDLDMKDADPEDDFVVPDDDDEEEIEVERPAKRARTSGAAASTKKRKSEELEDEDEEEQGAPKKGKGTKQTPKKPAAKKPKKEEVEDSAEMKAIFDSIPLVRPPTPPEPAGEKKKFPFGGHANSGPPPAEGAKEPPTGAENCLAGLTFVFTGLLDTLSREVGQALVKRYGGKVTTTPSSKTSYVVLGNDAGPKKIEVIQKHGIKTINEDGLFELIRRLPPNGGDTKAAAAYEEKKSLEMQKAKEAAEAAEEEEKQRAAAATAVSTTATGASAPRSKPSTAQDSSSVPDTRLWTVKHAPTQISQICGNKKQVEMLQRWLRAFQKNVRTGFKMAGPDAMGTYRAVIISGPPGIGKTTAAHLVAKLEGFDVVESNASDTRSKKLVLIMDEVDGMSAGDRGGVGALASLCKKTTIPIILICNDRKLPKMKPFDYVTFNMLFRRPTTEQIRARIMTIGYRERIKLPAPVLDALIEGTGADIRQVVNMLSTAKLDEQTSDLPMDYDRGKQMSKAWEKHIVLKPWDIVQKILGGGLFESASKSTLNDKIELYFNDHEFSSLMLQENYLVTKPIAARDYTGREYNLKNLELVDQAANSISEGDLIDRMIHGTQQHWSLMPAHAIFSFVRPASFVAGNTGGQCHFTSWLGKNSSQGKFMRQVKEIQGHMRLRASGDRHEIRQQYFSLLWWKIIKQLELEGVESVQDVIDLMDSYFLTLDDKEALLELGLGPMDQSTIRTDTKTKATFTRLYNTQSHPLPFMKASNVLAPKKAAKDKPDLEEAMDESDEAEVVDEDANQIEEEEVEGDLSKDKYVKQPKKKKAPSKAKKAAKEDDLDDDESEEDVKPKKGKGKATVKGKGKK